MIKRPELDVERIYEPDDDAVRGLLRALLGNDARAGRDEFDRAEVGT